jgi:NAD(P) transhydrogenase
MRRYDLVVIGSGPAGHHAAIQGAKLGKSVLVVEAQSRLGGAGLTTGTVPSKALRELAIGARRHPGHVLEAWPEATQGVMLRCREIVTREVAVYRAQFARNGVGVVQGLASLRGPGEVYIEGPGGGGVVAAGVIVIATGSTPARTAAVEVDGRTVVDTDAVLDLAAAPRSMIIVGAGIVGVEYACIFAALGARVTLVDVRPRLLPFVDHEIAEALGYQMRDAGITLRLGEEVASVGVTDGHAVAVLRSRKELRADVLLYAIGRHGNTARLNLSAAGIEADERGRIPVNEDHETRVPGIYAVGDVAGFPGLASVAMEQGRHAVCHAFGCGAGAGRRLFPYGIYTIPEVSFVGSTEQELTEAGVPYEVGIAHYREIARGQIRGDETGRLKLLFHRADGRLLGVHIIGEGATELIHIGQAVMSFGGSIDYFVESVFNYPTLAECYKVAALSGMNRTAAWEPAAAPVFV